MCELNKQLSNLVGRLEFQTPVRSRAKESASNADRSAAFSEAKICARIYVKLAYNHLKCPLP